MNFPRITDSGFEHTQTKYNEDPMFYKTIYSDLARLVDVLKKDYSEILR